MVIPPWRFSRLSNEGVSLTNQKSLRAVALLAGELAGAFNRHSPDASQTGVNSIPWKPTVGTALIQTDAARRRMMVSEGNTGLVCTKNQILQYW
jgi:hypothetical protein